MTHPVNIAMVERSTEMSMLGCWRRLFVSHSHDNYLLASELGFHGTISTSVTTAKRMLIAASKPHKISKGYHVYKISLHEISWTIKDELF